MKGENARLSSLTPMELWNMIEKLDFLFKETLGIGIIYEERSIYVKYRNAIAHSNIIPIRDEDFYNKSILEANISFISRHQNSLLENKLHKTELLDSNYEEITEELMCWVGLIHQVFSIYALWNIK